MMIFFFFARTKWIFSVKGCAGHNEREIKRWMLLLEVDRNEWFAKGSWSCNWKLSSDFW
jgi:hypothetical protein